MKQTKALVLFSGGQDSATCLLKALTSYDVVHTVAFNYGQRHAVELQVRHQFFHNLRFHLPELASNLGDDYTLDATALQAIGGTAMTSDAPIVGNAGGLPNTFVPGRNIVFLSMASALAVRLGVTDVITGVCETDYSGYPDCRDATIKYLQETLQLAGVPVEIKTPLMFMDKAATWELVYQIHPVAVALIRDDTHTCYMGDRTQFHSWGYGCGECPACQLRATGYKEWIDGQPREYM